MPNQIPRFLQLVALSGVPEEVMLASTILGWYQPKTWVVRVRRKGLVVVDSGIKQVGIWCKVVNASRINGPASETRSMNAFMGQNLLEVATIMFKCRSAKRNVRPRLMAALRKA